jgi:wyosine [tRNA(Phe)-imidazoG37] synthetase (radical SAM superfamily)
MSDDRDIADGPVTRDHRRQWRRCLYVYPVISRRAKGLSIGVNLNPDKRCTFSCLYCQINRRIRRDLHTVDLDALERELRQAMRAAVSGELWEEQRFARTPPAMRRINDIAVSGDGEPTCLANFDRAVAAAARIKGESNRDDVKIVIITNSTQLDQPQFLRALPILDAHNGEIWAKLDAGTDEYFQQINRPHPRIALQRIVDNIISVARGREVVIQTLLFRLDGSAPAQEELEAYSARIREILDAGGRVKLIQVHTIARSPQDTSAAALGDAQLDAIADQLRAALPDTPVETYYGADVAPQGDRQG